MPLMIINTVGRLFLPLTLLLCAVWPAAAHEYWFEPAEFMPQPGQSVPIRIHVGQNFRGNSFPYLREEFKKFVVADIRSERPVKAVDGDDPAVTLKTTTSGLVILA